MSWRRRKERLNQAVALDAHPRQRKTLVTHAFLAGFSALQILYLALDDLKLNIALSLGLAAGYIFSYHLPARWRGAAIYVVSALSAIVAVYHGFRYFADPSMYGNLLGTLGGLLLVLLSFQAFTTNSHRFNLILCVVFLLFGAVASYDLKFMLLLPLFLTFAGCALYTANQVDLQSLVADSESAEDGKGAGPAGASAGAGGGGLSRQFIGVLLRAVGLILGLSIAAYILAPHSASGPRGLIINRAAQVEEPQEDATQASKTQHNSNSAQVGLGDNYDLTDGRELTSVPTPVLKMKSHRNNYLRADVYDVFSGAGWQRSPSLEPATGKLGSLMPLPLDRPSADFEAQPGVNVPLVDFPSAKVLSDFYNLQVQKVDNNVFSKNEGEGLAYDVNQQQITLMDDQPPFYFSSYQPFRLVNVSPLEGGRLVDNLVVEDQASTIRARNMTHQHMKGFQYTIYSLEPKVNSKQLGQVYEKGPEKIRDLYTWLPLASENWRPKAIELGLDPDKVRPITQRFVNFARATFGDRVDKGSVWDAVQRINTYLVHDGGFEYSRDAQKLPEGMEVTEAFCMKTQAGYCRQFASTMAVLCRLNGIAARVVTGYAPGTYSLTDNAYVYKASDAHAWVEVYFDGYGWTMFDPTPTSRNILDRPAATQFIAGAIDFLQELFVIDPSATQRTMLDALIHLWTMIHDNALPVSAGAAMVVVGIVGIWLIQRRMRRRRPGKRLVPENGVVVAYLRTQGLLGQLGFISETGDTARALFDAAQQRFPWLREPLTDFLPLYERAAYSSESPQASEAEHAAELLARVDALVKEELEARRRSKGRG